MATEDFTTYTKADPESHLTVTATRCTYTNLDKDTDTWIYDDKGASHFDGDFEHLLDVYLDASDNLGYVYHWALTQEVNDIRWLQTNLKEILGSFFYRSGGGVYQLYIVEWFNGSGYTDIYNCSLDTTYYLKLKRDEAVGANGTLYCYIYSDPDRTTLLDTLSVSLHGKIDFQYIFACNTYNSGTTQKQSGYCENLDLQEAQTVSPTGIASAEAFGTVVIAGPIIAVSIASAEVFGTPTIIGAQTLSPTSIASAETFGTPTIATAYSIWTDWEVDAYAVALCSYGSTVFAFRIDAIDGHLYRSESADNGATFDDWIDMGDISGDENFRLAACFKNATNAIVLYSDGAALYRRRWNGETWEATAAWSNTLQTITGVAVTYMGDWNIVVTGIDTTGKPGVWTCILGDGYSGAVDTWSSLLELTIASAGSNLEFHAPSLSFPDVFRTFFVEKYTGSAAYSRPYWSHSLATADFISNLWREPIPFDLSANYGVAITYSGSYVWLTTPSGVWRASLVPASVNVTEDVLAMTSWTEPHSGRVVVMLRNDDGRYMDIGTGDYAAITEGSKLLLSPGYRTTSAPEASLGPAYWIEGWEYISEAGRSYLLLHGRDGWWLLDRWRARRQFSWAQGEKNIFQLLAFLFARAGLEFSAFSTSSAVVNQYPTFTIHPRESGATAVRCLLEMVPDVLFFVGDCGYIKNPLANEGSVYSYGSDHAILEGRYSSGAQGINRVQIYGDGVMSERFDWEEIANVYDRLGQVHDLNLDTLAKAKERGDAELREEQMAARGGEIVVPVNCGQDLYDVIEITDERAGLTSVKRRVMGMTLRYSTVKEARYEQRLSLGGV